MPALGKGMRATGDAAGVLLRLARVGALRLEARDIRARCEGLLTGSADDDAAERLVCVEHPGDFAELLPHRKGKRVEPLRIAERHRGDHAVALDEDLAAHR
jgi:hypothetical protein